MRGTEREIERVERWNGEEIWRRGGRWNGDGRNRYREKKGEVEGYLDGRKNEREYRKWEMKKA